MQFKKQNTIYRSLGQIFASKVKIINLMALFVLLLGSSSGCSYFSGDSKANEGAQTAVVQVSVEYLRLCLLANTAALNSYVLLGEYLRHKGLSIEEYHEQVFKLARRWPVSDNPVVQLRVLDANIHGDKATVKFQRDGSKSEYPPVTMELAWIGNSWIITNDSIFGKNGLFTTFK